MRPAVAEQRHFGALRRREQHGQFPGSQRRGATDLSEQRVDDRGAVWVRRALHGDRPPVDDGPISFTMVNDLTSARRKICGP